MSCWIVRIHHCTSTTASVCMAGPSMCYTASTDRFQITYYSGTKQSCKWSCSPNSKVHGDGKSLKRSRFKCCWSFDLFKWSCDILKLHETQTVFLSFCPSVTQLVLWSWRVLLFLWWRDIMWLCAVQTRSLPSNSQQISIKMASSSWAVLQETWPSTVFPSLMKDSTSAASLELENQQRAGWLSEVRHCSVLK